MQKVYLTLLVLILTGAPEKLYCLIIKESDIKVAMELHGGENAFVISPTH